MAKQANEAALRGSCKFDVGAAEKAMASVESDVFDIIAEQSTVDRTRLTRDARLDDLEIESLDVVEIIFALEEKFDIHVPYNANDQELQFETVGDVVDAVRKLVEEEGAA
jgi:acyl carrier protein